MSKRQERVSSSPRRFAVAGVIASRHEGDCHLGGLQRHFNEQPIAILDALCLDTPVYHETSYRKRMRVISRIATKERLILSKHGGLNYAWAKLDKDGVSLPLEAHAGDVAAVLERLLLEGTWAARLNQCAGRPLTYPDRARLLVLGFLHDLGKANCGFWKQQFPGANRVGHSRETAALFYAPSIAKQPTPQRLCDLVLNWGASDLFAAAMAHHGRPLDVYAGDEQAAPDLGRTARDQVKTERRPAEYWIAGNGYDPLAQLGCLLDLAALRFPAAFEDGPSLPSSAAFVSLFCGLLTLADWLGSDTSFFPIAGPHGAERDAMRMAGVARATGGRGLRALTATPCSFAAAFGVAGPRGLQGLADDQSLGPVALLEAETGSGKTEAALWRWLALRRAGAVDGLYFALPTRAAAVQLHGRVQATLHRVFDANAPEAVLAVPGYLRAGDAEGQALPDFGVTWSDEGAGDERWAAERPKRFLAARVAVGTIDQVLMAGLQLRHAHLRAACLSRSLLVVDEVHASDAFMGAVLEQVLSNHRALGGHALLLSATLTAEVRNRLLGRPAAASLAAACGVAYPALSGSERDPPSSPAVARLTKRVALETLSTIDDAGPIAVRAIAAARAGASVLVVRNSVGGAVAVARSVAAMAPEFAFRVREVATLHHGRFGPGDRRLLDAAVEAEFGKKRDARGRILCGTQTLEQSLDLDADLLITDLAPMDVLLQRIGRLHRHPRRDRGAFDEARALVLVPEERDLSVYLGPVRYRHGLGPVRDGKGVYPDVLVLHATLQLIEANPVIEIPTDNRRLVEGALHPDALERLKCQLGTAWINHAHAQDGTALAERCLARHWTLDLSAPFGTLLFPDLDEAVATRLGTRDRMVDFDPPFTGPFGQLVTRLTVPGWMAGSVSADAAVMIDAQEAEATRFSLGDRGFSYGPYGLEGMDNP